MHVVDPETGVLLQERVYDRATGCVEGLKKAYTYYQQKEINVLIRMVDNQNKVIVLLEPALNEYQFTNQLSI